MKIEYLILIKKDGSFCDSEKSFLSFLKTDSNIEVDKKQIKYKLISGKDKIYFDYSLSSGEVGNLTERYFILELRRVDQKRKNDITQFTRQLKKIISRIHPDNVKINTLWDDIAMGYSKSAYPVINNLENLMRKLISKFMLINVGMEWSKNSIHEEIINKFDRNKSIDNLYFDEIYKADFIHLSDILFKKYRDIDINTVDKILGKSQKITAKEIENLKSFVPSSNWEKHFSKVIQFDEEKLKEYWRKLYDYRNCIAHNRGLSRSEYEEILSMTTKVEKVINDAILNLDKIKLEEDEKRNIIKEKEEINQASNQLLKYIIHSYDDDITFKGFSGKASNLFDLVVENPKFLDMLLDKLIPGKTKKEGIYILKNMMDGKNKKLMNNLINRFLFRLENNT